MLTVLNGGGASACTITSLEKFTLYDFFLIPFFKNIEGRPSNSKLAATLDECKLDIEKENGVQRLIEMEGWKHLILAFIKSCQNPKKP